MGVSVTISVTRSSSQDLRNKISVTDFFSRIWGMQETNTNSKLELVEVYSQKSHAKSIGVFNTISYDTRILYSKRIRAAALLPAVQPWEKNKKI